MPYNGSGTFSLTYNWATEQASSPIEIAKLDTQESDIAAGLSNCILRDGTGLPSTTIPWNSQALTGVSNLSAERVTVTGSTVPVNGMYLSAANTVAFATNTTARAFLDSATLGVGGAASVSNAAKSGTDRMVEVSSTTNGDIVGFQAFANDGVNGRRAMLWVDDTAGTFGLTGTASSGVPDFKLEIGGLTPLSVNSSGNVTIAAPSSGTALSVTGLAGANAMSLTAAGQVTQLFTNSANSVTGFAGCDTSTFFVGSTSAHSTAIYSGNSIRVNVGSAGNVTIAAPSSGDALTVNAAASSYGLVIAQQPTTPGLRVSNGSGSMYLQASGGNSIVGTDGAWGLDLYTNTTQRLSVNSTGNVTINAASSGDELTVAGSVVATSFAGALTGDVTGNVSGSSGSCTGNAATATALQTARTINGTSFNGTANITVTASADTLTGTTLPALSGVNLTALNATQLTSGTVPAARIGSSTDYAVGDGSTVNGIQIGFRGIPQNSQTANYTCVLADAGKHILHASGGGAGDTFTIPANGSVAYAIGTTITFVNADSNSVSIAITTDTMTLAGTTTTGTRTLGQNGVATAIKVGTTSWIISGTGLT